jgi:quinol monooxygenase YgiN
VIFWIFLRSEKNMYGLIVKLKIISGRRDDVIRLLHGSTIGMPGRFSYIVAKDATDEDLIWVTEIWDTVASHDASLSLPSVRNVFPQVKPLVAAFDKVAVTIPVAGIGPGLHPPAEV